MPFLCNSCTLILLRSRTIVTNLSVFKNGIFSYLRLHVDVVFPN